MQSKIFCKEILIGEEWDKNGLPIKTKKIYGRISESSDFFLVKTRNNTYKINKKLVLRVRDTNIPFEEGDLQ